MDAEDSTTGFVDCAFSLDFLFPPMGCGTRQLKQGKLNEALTVFNMVRGAGTMRIQTESVVRLRHVTTIAAWHTMHGVVPLYQEWPCVVGPVLSIDL